MNPTRTFRRLALGALAFAVSWPVACAEDGRVPSEPPAVQAGKGGNGGGGSGSGPTVEDTDPGSAPQNTTLDVQVFGSGFDDGSQVDLLLDGSTTTNVRTNSTRFVSGSELVANITIAADAQPELYDVRVTTSRGKKGIGIELFEVIGATGDFSEEPSPSAAGLYEDGFGLYDRGGFQLLPNTDGNFNITAYCELGRAFEPVFPTEWLAEFPSDPTRIARCGGDSWEQVRFHAPGLLYEDCTDPSGCRIGGPHVDGSPNYSPDVHYFFSVDTNGDGKLSRGKNPEEPYNVVWVDGTYTVEGRASDATPCKWHITARTAQLWRRDATLISDAAGAPMHLDVVVTRTDGPCAVGVSL